MPFNVRTEITQAERNVITQHNRNWSNRIEIDAVPPFCSVDKPTEWNLGKTQLKIIINEYQFYLAPAQRKFIPLRRWLKETRSISPRGASQRRKMSVTEQRTANVQMSRTVEVV